MLVKIKEKNYIRDTNSMALINNDKSAKEEYIMKTKMMQLQKTEMSRINNEINTIKADVNDIKALLIQLISDKK